MSPLQNFSYVGQGCDEEAEGNEKGNASYEGNEGDEEITAQNHMYLLGVQPGVLEGALQLSSLDTSRIIMAVL